MINCKNCQFENPQGASFCADCGKPLKEQVAAPAGDDLASAQTVSPYETIGRKEAKNDSKLDYTDGDLFAGRYTIGSLIGRGGMGVVYRATDRHGDREVALKLIRPDLLTGPESMKRLISEGVTTQDLSHDNIVRVYNVDEADGLPYVAMEFVEGITLAEWHRARMAAREQVPTQVAGRIMMEVLSGLEAAHDAGIIHRDLKPQNIILTAEPDAKSAPLKILDFGIARAADQEESLAGTAMGTPGYMAPEQRTDPDLVDNSADIYALSKIFYKMLMDALPDGMWQPPSGSRGDVPEPVDTLILAGISVNRLGRPQTVSEYRERLIAAMNNKVWSGPTPTPPVPRPSPPPPPPPPPGPRPAPFDFSEWISGPGKPVGIGCGGLIVLFFVILVIGEMFDNEDYISPTDTPEQLYDTPVTDLDDPGAITGATTVNTFARYSGTWHRGSGTPWSVTLDSNGVSATEKESSNGSGQSWSYRLDFDTNGISRTDLTDEFGETFLTIEYRLLPNDCHVQMSEIFMDGSVNPVEKFHVNHLPGPGRDCPAGF